MDQGIIIYTDGGCSGNPGPGGWSFVMRHGVEEIIGTGGLPDKNHLLMQIYADVTGMEVKVSAAKQTPAVGSAMFGAVAAGKAAGGYDSIYDAARYMARLRNEVYRPDPAAHAIYDRLFAEYLQLHDYFGRGANDVMKRLKSLKTEVIFSRQS